MDVYSVLQRTSHITYDSRGKAMTVRPAQGVGNAELAELNDACLRMVDKALCANEHGVMVVDSLWLFESQKTTKDDWHRRSAFMTEMALQPWNLPLLDPVVPVDAKVLVFPIAANHHWSALVWYRHHEATDNLVVLHHYDSMPNMHTEWVEFMINEWLSDNRQLFFDAARPHSAACVQVVRATHFPIQDDAHSCGFRIAALIDLLVERARRGLFTPIDSDDPQLIDTYEFNARRWRIITAIHKQCMRLLPGFPHEDTVNEAHQHTLLTDDTLVRHVYQSVLELDADHVDAILHNETGTSPTTDRQHLLPVLAIQRDTTHVLDDSDEQVFGLIWRDEFASHRPPNKTVANAERNYKLSLQRRHAELVLLTVPPRTPHCAASTFGYASMADPETVWHHFALALQVVHHVRLWAHELWVDLLQQGRQAPLSPDARQAYNRAVLKDALHQRFRYTYSHTAEAPYAIHNSRRFIDGVSAVLRYCAQYRDSGRVQALSFSQFSTFVLCTMVCEERIVIAPVRVRCSSSTFGPCCHDSTTTTTTITLEDDGLPQQQAPDTRVLSDDILGLAMLWRGYVGQHHQRQQQQQPPPLRMTVSHAAAPRSHCAQATLWHAFRVADPATPYGTPCPQHEHGGCFWRFVCNDAPEPTLLWTEFVAQGLRAFYSSIIASSASE